MSAISALNATKPASGMAVWLVATFAASAICCMAVLEEQYWVFPALCGTFVMLALLNKLREVGRAKWLLILLFINIEAFSTFLLFFIPGYEYGHQFQQLQRIGALIEGVPLIAITGLMVILEHETVFERFYWSEIVLLLFGIGCAAIGLIIGLSLGNDLTYLIADTYKLVVVPCAFVLTIALLQKCSDERIVRTFQLAIYFFTVVASLSCFIHIYQIVIGSEYLRIGGYEILPITYWLVRWVQGVRSRPLLHFSLLAVLFTSAVLSLSRITWIQSLFLIFILLTLWGRRFLWRGGILLLLVCSTLSVVAFLNESNTETAINLVKSYYADLTRPLEGEGRMGVSTERKASESESVLEAIRNWSSPLLYLSGVGAGAEFQALSGATELWNIYRYRSGQAHNIHDGPLALFYRYGFIGTLLFLVWAVSAALFLRRSVVRVRSVEQRVICATVYIYWLLSLLKLLSVVVIIDGDPTFGFLLGTVSVLYRRVNRNGPYRLTTQSRASVNS